MTPDNSPVTAGTAAPPASEEPSAPGRPRVSIGLPVYNAERYLEPTLASVAAQTFPDWELVISDNASTDRTWEICEERAEHDPRIRLSRNPVNIGGDRNWNRCIELSRGEYFLGIGSDDLLHPEYLSRTVAALDADPGAVFCHSRAIRIDAAGKELGPYPARVFSGSDSPSVRLREAILDTTDVFSCLGLTRASAFPTPVIKPHPYSDSFLQARLALKGRFIEIPEFLFRRRYFPAAMSIYDRIGWCDPEKASTFVFPHWRRLGEYFAAAARAPVPFSERLRCVGVVLQYCRKVEILPKLRRDLRMAVRQALLSTRLGRRLRDRLREAR